MDRVAGIHILLAVVLLLVASPAKAQDAQADWMADPNTGCRVWNAPWNRLKPKDTISWSGSCVDGLASGRGVLQCFNDGKPTSRYEGDIRQGKINGRGTYVMVYGMQYEGEWRDGSLNGSGIMTSKIGARYEGEWRNHKPHGKGTFRDSNGNVYTGTWTNGCWQQGNRQAAVNTSGSECGFR